MDFAGIFQPLIEYVDGWALWFGSLWIWVKVAAAVFGWVVFWGFVAKCFEGELRKFAFAMIFGGVTYAWGRIQGYLQGNKAATPAPRPQSKPKPKSNKPQGNWPFDIFNRSQ